MKNNALITGIFVLIIIPLTLAASETTQQELFRIERNKNANIVRYDARLDPDGRLARKDPVVAYWIRLAEQGQEQELSWLQKTFAYGFDAELSEDRTQLTLKLKAEIGRPLLVRCAQFQCRTTAKIDGASAYLRKIFVQSSGKGLATSVEFIELFGEDVNGGGERYERLVP